MLNDLYSFLTRLSLMVYGAPSVEVEAKDAVLVFKFFWTSVKYYYAVPRIEFATGVLDEALLFDRIVEAAKRAYCNRYPSDCPGKYGLLKGHTGSTSAIGDSHVVPDGYLANPDVNTIRYDDARTKDAKSDG